MPQKPCAEIPPIVYGTELTDRLHKQKGIEVAIDTILAQLPIDRHDANFKGTPERVAEAMIGEWFSGYWQEPRDVVTLFPNDSNFGDLVIVKDIPFYSMCSHHMAPFFGTAAIAYIPDKSVFGLSKLSRIVDIFGRRLQLQENITAQVADAMMTLAEPKGVMVILENVEHTCMTSRGVKAHGSSTTTSAVRGIFHDDSTLRLEALTLMRSK